MIHKTLAHAMMRRHAGILTIIAEIARRSIIAGAQGTGITSYITRTVCHSALRVCIRRVLDKVRIYAYGIGWSARWVYLSTSV